MRIQSQMQRLFSRYPEALARTGEILARHSPPGGRAAGRVAWKTGTSYGHRDALALGWDGRFVAGVWIGRPDGTPVPGAFGAWLTLLRDYGTWELADVLRPAIDYARNGFPLVPRISQAILAVQALFRDEWKSSGDVWLPGGRVPAPDALFRTPAIAATYTRILDEAHAASTDRRGRIDAALDASEYKTLAEYDTPDWAPPKAQEFTAGQINRFGADIKGIVAANDGTAGGAIAALKAAGVDPLPPVTGNDATIAALQLIIAGDQYNTISKPSEIVARAAAEVAVAFLKGETPEAKTTLYDTPSELFVPAVVTRENIKAEIFDKGIQTPEEICTADYAEACRELGILE